MKEMTFQDLFSLVFLFLPGFGTTQGTELIIALERIGCCFTLFGG